MKNSGRCTCCGKGRRTVWGYVYRDGGPRACYFVEWTLGRSDCSARFDVVVGQWFDGTSESDRETVSLEYRLLDSGPSFAVVDARGPSGRRGRAREEGRRDRGTPLAEEALTIAERRPRRSTIASASSRRAPPPDLEARPAARLRGDRSPSECYRLAAMTHPTTDSSGASVKTILVVDDEKNIRRTLQLVLEGEGYRVIGAETAEHAIEILASPNTPVDLAIFDVKLPGMSGLEALERLRKEEATRDTPIIVISGHATVNDAVHAIKLGASDFFEKPLARERVLVSVKNVLEAAQTQRALETMSREQLAKYEMIGKSAPIQRLFHEIEKVAPTRASVLITGESGTGKELIARAIHRLSSRVEEPFIKVNCAAIPRELIESELFGHEKGAFTGAQVEAAWLLRAGRTAARSSSTRSATWTSSRRPRSSARCSRARSRA